jgi:hypothetical protein
MSLQRRHFTTFETKNRFRRTDFASLCKFSFKTNWTGSEYSLKYLLVLLNFTGVPVVAVVRDIHSVHVVAGFPAGTSIVSLMFIPFMLLLACLPLQLLASLMFIAFMS